MEKSQEKIQRLLISILFLEITSKDTWSNIKYINMPVHWRTICKIKQQETVEMINH